MTEDIGFRIKTEYTWLEFQEMMIRAKQNELAALMIDAEKTRATIRELVGSQSFPDEEGIPIGNITMPKVYQPPPSPFIEDDEDGS